MSGPGSDARFGSYRRAIRIAADGDTVTAEMEDDIHHFGISLHHAGGTVSSINGSAWRTPWTICPGALTQLDGLVGERLDYLLELPAALRAQQCMHLYDLVLTAIRHAGKSGFGREYRVEGDYDQSPPLLRLWCDGAQVLEWSAVGGIIRGSQFDGIALKDLARTFPTLTADEAEAALVLRRATLIAPVRMVNLDDYRAADHISPNAPAVCFARQPQRTASAARSRGSSRDFHADGRWPLELST